MQAARCHLSNSHKTLPFTRSVRRNQPSSRPRSRRSGGCARRSPTRGRSRSGSGAAPLPPARLRPPGAAAKGGRAPSAASRHGGPGRRGAAGERQPPHLPPLRGAARDGEGGGRRAARLHRRPGDLRYPDGMAGPGRGRAGQGRAGCGTGGQGRILTGTGTGQDTARGPFLNLTHLIRSINDPEHPLTLEELNVVEQVRVKVNDAESTVAVEFTPTIPHCSMATLIGLSIKVKLIRSLPERFKMDVHITPGTHASEHAVNKQLADKERVAAALENSHLLEVVNQCLSARS
ncbi:Mitotic spindle-associated MMXD complex subunit MIP18 [Aix galericulata]|nr:Mitotic spindle-associated MMXD complex subunit MIP18 [Aix galericulata]